MKQQRWLSEPQERGVERLITVIMVHPDYRSGECVYCGETADTKDHLLPRSWTGESQRTRVPVVPACRECNSIINDRIIPMVWDRREVVHKALRRKYKRSLKAVIWSEEEIEQFGPQLRLVISRRVEEHNRTMARLAWPPSPTYDADAWLGAWEEEISNE